MKKSIIIGLTAFLILGLIFKILGNAGEEPREDILSRLNLEESPSMGNPEAPVVMVNYSSYYCPFCLEFKRSVFPALKEKYIDTGKLFYIYKDSANPRDPVSLAPHCAEDFFWEYQSLLQEEGVMVADDLWILAEKVGIDNREFSDCLEQEIYSYKIEQAAREMRDLEIEEIPFFIINGEVVSGLAGIAQFERIINREIES